MLNFINLCIFKMSRKSKCPLSAAYIMKVFYRLIPKCFSVVFVGNSEQNLHIALVFLLVTWKSKCCLGKCYEDVNVSNIDSSLFRCFKTRDEWIVKNWRMDCEIFRLSTKTLPKEKQPPEKFYKNGVVQKRFAKFTEKQLLQTSHMQSSIL